MRTCLDDKSFRIEITIPIPTMKFNLFICAIGILVFFQCSEPVTYDVIIRNGQIIDGSGNPGFSGDVGINKDTIAAIGNLRKDIGVLEMTPEDWLLPPDSSIC